MMLAGLTGSPFLLLNHIISPCYHGKDEKDSFSHGKLI